MSTQHPPSEPDPPADPRPADDPPHHNVEPGEVREDATDAEREGEREE